MQDPRIKLLTPAKLKQQILYEDEYLLIVNKPKGISVLQERSGSNYYLLHLLKTFHSGLKVCHRLDKGTSGVLILAKDLETYRAVALQFQKRKVEKVYWALCHGVHDFRGERFEHILKIGRKRSYIVRGQEGKRCIVQLRTLEHFGHYTLVEAMPITGRFHQIRAQLAYMGAPVVGDSLYGGEDLYFHHLKKRFKGAIRTLPLNIGFLLHAYKVTFQHPHKQQLLSVEAPLDKNFQGCLKVLRQYDPPFEGV